MKIKILIPVYNDWQSLFKLIEEINQLQISNEFQISILIVNDASNHDRSVEEKKFKNIQSIKILNMTKNQGHARCIATGLKYLFEKNDFDYIIPMDGDGEDRPEEIRDFLNKIKNSNDKAIVGERVKRSENLKFKVCYFLHKLFTFAFTGQLIKFGNFTCLPKLIVGKMINEKWKTGKIRNGSFQFRLLRMCLSSGCLFICSCLVYPVFKLIFSLSIRKLDQKDFQVKKNYIRNRSLLLSVIINFIFVYVYSVKVIW